MKFTSEYFRELRKKVSKESLRKSGRLGGLAVVSKYGKDYLRKIGEKGRKRFKERIRKDKKLREKFRKDFIEKMKKFTRKYPTLSGIYVRSKLEQEVANILSRNNIKFEYETLTLKEKSEEFVPDFIIKNKNHLIVLEIFGMDTDFYLRKKMRKLRKFIPKNNKYTWIIFNPFHLTFMIENTIEVYTLDELVSKVKQLLNP